MGQQIAEGRLDKVPVPPAHQDGEPGSELKEHLPAGSAGPAIVLAAPHHRQFDEIAVAFAHRLNQGGALGADARAVGGVFHVAAGEHGAVGAQQGGPHREMGVGHIGALQHGKGQVDKSLICHR